MPETADRIESLFAGAVALPPEERGAYLERECCGDPALRDRVLALLRAHDRAGHVIDRPVNGDADQTAGYAPTSEQAGSIIAGRYKLLEEIGQGGMGTVWAAEQSTPVRRKVALKLIKAGMDSRSVLARFEAERQALALMDHPNIAKVLDGGLTDSGRPYFVMEYVKGVPITEYCDGTRLSVEDRLNLFVQVCSALQHAHQKGIIHRDLKPSNILVAPYDDKAVPKVIDFGLAKAMHQSLTEKTLYTAHEMVLGTPLYMSPEQAQLNNLDVDTRADIYSLGVLLYELLTGTTPLERKRFKEAAWDEIRRMIREEEPPRPSIRLSSTGTLPSLAAFRHTEPAKLKKLVRGELDWIVMKALVHTGVSEDFLLKEEKFKDLRNRLLKSASDFYGKLSTLLGKETDVASRRALAQSNFELADLTGMVGRKEAALAAHQAVLAAREALAAEPGADNEATVDFGRSLTAVAFLLESTGKTDEALAAYRRSESLLAGLAKAEPAAWAALAACRTRMAHLLRYAGKPALALAALKLARTDQEALAASHDASSEARRDLAATADELGWLLWQTGNPPDAEPEFRAALEIQRKLADENPAVTEFRSSLANSHLYLGLVLSTTGKPAEAEAEWRTGLAIYQKLADQHPAVTIFRRYVAGSRQCLGTLLTMTGKPAEAEGELRTSLAVLRKLATDADSDYERAIALEEPQAQQNPTNTGHRYVLVSSIRRRGLTGGDLGDPAGASADVRRALGLCEGPLSGWDLFETACCHAALAGLAGQAGSGVSAAEGEAAAAKAMDYLCRAVAVGYRNANQLRIESALDPLRDRADFNKLMAEL